MMQKQKDDYLIIENGRAIQTIPVNLDTMPDSLNLSSLVTKVHQQPEIK